MFLTLAWLQDPENLQTYFTPVTKAASLAAKQIQDYLDRPETRELIRALSFYTSIGQAGLIEHPILYQYFKEKIDSDEVRSRWEEIKQYLWDARPPSLMTNNRDGRYEQLLNAQSCGAYIAVCRGVYPEIERILRETFLTDKPEFVRNFSKMDNQKKRKSYISTEFAKIRNSTVDTWGVSLEATLEEVGIFTAAFLIELQKVFDNFDTADALAKDQQSKTGDRHLHAHGWKDNASFSDALSSLFLYDMCMQMIAHGKDWPKIVSY